MAREREKEERIDIPGGRRHALPSEEWEAGDREPDAEALDRPASEADETERDEAAPRPTRLTAWKHPQ